MTISGPFLASQIRVWPVLLVFMGGCNTLRNGWLDPTAIGNYSSRATNEIRASLSLEDSPQVIPGATYPTLEDLKVITREYPITPGDTLAIEINELRQRAQPFQAQLQVSPSGYINLPVVGRIRCAGLTVPQFQENIASALRGKEVLVEPDVTVNPQFMQKATYSIFGIGVSASNVAPLRAGIFPIRRPDLRLLDAINQVGGLNEFVNEVYIFRYDSGAPDDVEFASIFQDAAASPNPETATAESERAGSGPNGQERSIEAQSPPRGSVKEEHQRPADAEYNELLRAAEGSRDDHERANVPPSPAEENLAPEAPAPFLYVNGQFIPNPEFHAPPQGEAPTSIPSTDSVTPAVNWSRLAGETTFRVILVPAEHLRSGDPQSNIFVRAGDIIRIVSGEIGVYYVMGQVNRVGPFQFNAEPITLKQAIANAGGLSGLAWPDRCTVYRQLGGREQMIQVNLDRIFGGQEADFYIRRGDIVNVGTRPFAPFLQRIRAWTLPTPQNNVGYSFEYARNFADIDSFAVKQNPADKPKQFPNLFP